MYKISRKYPDQENKSGKNISAYEATLVITGRGKMSSAEPITEEQQSNMEERREEG